MNLIKEGRKAVILQHFLDKPEVETVRFQSNSDDVDILIHAPRGDGGEVPWWQHKGTIDTVYVGIIGDL